MWSEAHERCAYILRQIAQDQIDAERTDKMLLKNILQCLNFK